MGTRVGDRAARRRITRHLSTQASGRVQSSTFMKKDPRIDAYIAKSAAFAKPILEHLRDVVHEGCPECEEDLKWGHPSFIYKGIMCGMAAFKAHATFGFWKGGQIVSAKDRKTGNESGMGQFGRITSVDELPSRKVLLGYVKQAVKLQDAGAVAP